MKSKALKGKLAPVSRLCEIISGGTPKTSVKSYWNGSIGWLSVKDFIGEVKYVSSSEKTITNDGLNNSSTNLLIEGDVIISARGTVGEIAVIAKPMAFNQSCFGLRTKDEKVLDQGYLYYALKYAVKGIRAITQGSVFETINRASFEKINLPVFDSYIQKVIARILSCIDEKIQLNNEINRNLVA